VNCQRAWGRKAALIVHEKKAVILDGLHHRERQHEQNLMPNINPDGKNSTRRSTRISPRGFLPVTIRNKETIAETRNRDMSYPVKKTISGKVPDLDNLRIRLWLNVHQLSEVLEQYKDFCDDKLCHEALDHPMWRDNQYWIDRYQSINGASLLIEQPDSDGTHLVRLEIPGKVCGSMSLVKKIRFMRYLDGFKHKAMRLDPCIDDFDKAVPWEELMKVRRSQMKHKRKFKFTADLDQDDDGHIARAGSRQSENFGRAYQKCLESDGRIDSDRIEAEIKGDRAQALWKELVAIDPDKNLEEVMQLLAEAALAPFEILEREPDDDTQADRLEAPQWWKDYTEGFQFWKPKIERIKTTWEDKAKWVLSQYKKTLAEIRAVYGRNGFALLVEQAVIEGTKAFKQSNIDTIAENAKPTEYFREHYEDPLNGEIFARTAY
jgi:hypothetical protein